MATLYNDSVQHWHIMPIDTFYIEFLSGDKYNFHQIEEGSSYSIKPVLRQTSKGISKVVAYKLEGKIQVIDNEIWNMQSLFEGSTNLIVKNITIINFADKEQASNGDNLTISTYYSGSAYKPSTVSIMDCRVNIEYGENEPSATIEFTGLYSIDVISDSSNNFHAFLSNV